VPLKLHPPLRTLHLTTTQATMHTAMSPQNRPGHWHSPLWVHATVTGSSSNSESAEGPAASSTAAATSTGVSWPSTLTRTGSGPGSLRALLVLAERDPTVDASAFRYDSDPQAGALAAPGTGRTMDATAGTLPGNAFGSGSTTGRTAIGSSPASVVLGSPLAVWRQVSVALDEQARLGKTPPQAESDL
jgi:hypothetical protein